MELPPASVLASWRERDALLGRSLSWTGGTGVAQGVNAEGRLLVMTDSGTVTELDAGEVHLTGRGPAAV